MTDSNNVTHPAVLEAKRFSRKLERYIAAMTEIGLTTPAEVERIRANLAERSTIALRPTPKNP